MRNLMQFPLSCLVGSLCVSLAHSATLPYSDSVVLPNDVSTTLYLPKFDTALGSLTGIHMEVGINLTGARVQLDNDDVHRRSERALSRPRPEA